MKKKEAWKAFAFLYSTRSQSALFFRLPRFAQKCAVKNAHILTALSILLVVNCTSGPIPTQFLISGPSTLTNSTCSTAYTVSAVDGNNSSVVSPSDIEVFFSLIVTNVAGGFFFSDPACADRVESIKLKQDTSSVTFYFLGSATPKLSLVADDGQGGITPGSIEVTFQ